VVPVVGDTEACERGRFTSKGASTQTRKSVFCSVSNSSANNFLIVVHGAPKQISDRPTKWIVIALTSYYGHGILTSGSMCMDVPHHVIGGAIVFTGDSLGISVVSNSAAAIPMLWLRKKVPAKK
jgi:hypothetical protein